MVLQGDVILQEDESAPVDGFTLTDTSAAPTPWMHDAQSRMALVSHAALACNLPDAALWPNRIRAENRKTFTNDEATANKRRIPEASSKLWLLMDLPSNAVPS